MAGFLSVEEIAKLTETEDSPVITTNPPDSESSILLIPNASILVQLDSENKRKKLDKMIRECATKMLEIQAKIAAGEEINSFHLSKLTSYDASVLDLFKEQITKEKLNYKFYSSDPANMNW